MTQKKLTPQQRAEKFNEEYIKLCEKWQCQHVPVVRARQEGRIVISEPEMQVMVNDAPSS